MLRKLLFAYQDKKQLYVAIIGSFLGLTFLITSIHYLVRINEFGQGAEILGPNTLIIQKKVTSASTMKLTKTDYSEKEINFLKKQPSVLQVKPVISNNFGIWFETDDEMIPPFKTDIYVQTVDPSFLDVKSKKWHWKEGDEYVPIIMPRQILVMLNAFASSAGFPQVSEELAMDVNFKFALKGENEKEWFKVRVIGFSNQVNSILVPEEFMTFGNAKYAPDKPTKITQLVISGKESKFGDLEGLIKENGMESKNEDMIMGRLKSMVSTLIIIILGVSIVAVFMAGLVLIQYAQLLLSRNAYEVRTLLRIGYSPKVVIKQFFVYFVKVFSIIASCSIITFMIFKLLLDSKLKTGGLYIDTAFTLSSFGALVAAFLLYAYANYRNIKKGVMKEYRG